MTKYDSLWTGYGHNVVLKTSGNGTEYVVKLDGEIQASIDSEEQAKALFTGIIKGIRDGKIGKIALTVH